MKQNQFEFKPFDKVLVRDRDEDTWSIDFYSHFCKETIDAPYNTTGKCCWSQCIPYNEETKHLVGTNNPYQPNVKGAVYQVKYISDNKFKMVSYSEESFKEFIDKAICNNKDIKDFSVNIITSDQFSD